MKEANPVSTPGENTSKDATGNGDALDERHASKFSSMAARANYLAFVVVTYTTRSHSRQERLFFADNLKSAPRSPTQGYKERPPSVAAVT